AIPAVPADPLRRHHDAALAAARTALPGAEYRAAFAKGAAMSQAEAIAFAMGEVASRPDRTRESAGPGQLTRREQDGAAPVARGPPNSQRGAALVIAPGTGETQVQHIMDKLGCPSGAQIAAGSAALRAAAPPRPDTRRGPAGPGPA